MDLAHERGLETRILASYNDEYYLWGRIEITRVGSIMFFPSNAEYHITIPKDGHAHISKNDHSIRHFYPNCVKTIYGDRRKEDKADGKNIKSPYKNGCMDVTKYSSGGSWLLYVNENDEIDYEKTTLEQKDIIISIEKNMMYYLDIYRTQNNQNMQPITNSKKTQIVILQKSQEIAGDTWKLTASITSSIND